MGKLNDKDALVERALELIPKELETARYRRTMRAAEMNMKKTHLPIEEQNYDPMIPYMAPYMEEAKFQLQGNRSCSCTTRTIAACTPGASRDWGRPCPTAV